MAIVDLRSQRQKKDDHPEPRWLVWTLRFLAYAIPLGFLLYVLYWNFLPFGYEKTFTIDVGSPGDTSGEFYLEPSRDLSERKTAADGTTYRELNGIAYAVFRPKAVLKNAQITVSVEGEGVSIIPPVIDFDPDSVQWDYAWDFTQPATTTDGGHSNILENVGMSTSTETTGVLTGNAFPFDGCMYFDGKSRLELPDSADLFESGPFTVYAEWTPEDNTKDFQEIVGHFNWELLQNKNSVSFRIGRVDNATGTFYSITYPITSDFFNTKHSATATYSPSNSGYIDLYVDGNHANRISIGTSVIWIGYGKGNLTFGKAGHAAATYFNGCLFHTNFHNKLITDPTINSFTFSGTGLKIPIEGTASTSLSSVLLHVNGK